jgi:hypothetical protein
MAKMVGWIWNARRAAGLVLRLRGVRGRALACAALVTGAFAACSVEDRDLRVAEGAAQGNGEPPGGGDMELGAPGQPLNTGPSGLGASCSQDVDCVSTFCVDGVCCSSSCDLVCTSCNAPGNAGSCTVVGFDPECGGSCPENTDCLSYGSGAVAANCEAPGQCRVVAEADCQEALATPGSPCVAGTGSCNEGGACAVAGKKLLGEACSANEECAEGHCVVASSGGSVCCTTACDGPCQACSDAGRCKEVPAGDPLCQPVDCPADNLCRDYSDDLTTDLCRGFGECLSVRDCKFQELRSAVDCACESDGTCSLVQAAACSADAECRSGLCQPTLAGASLCCALDCAAQGLRCGSDGASCVECDGNASECTGPSSSRTCVGGKYEVSECGNGCDVGTGLCTGLKPLGAACESSVECGSTLCAPDLNETNRCCDPSCASDRVCGEAGGCVCPADHVELNGQCLRAAGLACTSGVECASGACVGTVSGSSVCCETPCAAGTFCSADGARCVQCEGSGAACAGSVSQSCVDEVLEETPCGNGCNPTTGFCNGLLGQGATCTDDVQCGSGLCSPDTLGTDRCCPTNCEATGRVCGSDGSCVCPAGREFVRGACRLVVGQPCATANDCSSSACVATEFNGSVCCTSTCPGLQCRGSGQGCVECEGTGSECQGNTVARCQNNFLQLSSCGNGCTVQGGQASCNALRGRGNTCTQSTQCVAGLECASAAGGTRCCDPGCTATGRSCDANGQCQCPPGQAFAGTRCGVDQGGVCSRTSDCLGNLPCTPFFLDNDFDGFGSEQRSVCGTTPPPPVSKAGERGPVDVLYVPSGGDCCDLFGDQRSNTSISSASSSVFPGQTVSSSRPANNCTIPFDFNCDGVVSGPVVTDFANPAGCGTDPATCGANGGVTDVSPTCPGSISVLICVITSLGTCTSTGNGGPISCL